MADAKGTRNRSYRFFSTKCKNEQNLPAKVPRQHLGVLLAYILPALPPEKQCQLLQMEVYEAIEISRKKLVGKGIFKIDEAFGLYSDYLAFLYRLGDLASFWFEKKNYTVSDWKEVLETVKFVVVTRLRASALHFRKDLRIIAQNSELISAKIMYHIDFLEADVRIKSTQYSLERLFIFDELPIPTVVGKFAETLRSYIFEALENTEYQLATQEMQDGLLKQDFRTALIHYKESNPIVNKVDISFSLQGGAGKVSMDIKTWATLGKRMLHPFKRFFKAIGDFVNVEITAQTQEKVITDYWQGDYEYQETTATYRPILAILAGGGIIGSIVFVIWLIASGGFFALIAKYPIFKLIFAVGLTSGICYGVWRAYKGYHELNQAQPEQTELVISRPSDWERVLADKQDALEAKAYSEDEWERAYHAIMTELQNKFKNYADIYLAVDNALLRVLDVYQAFLQALRKEVERFQDVSGVNISALKYLILKRLQISLQHFKAVERCLHTKQITFLGYFSLLNIQANIATYYDQRRNAWQETMQKITQDIEKEATKMLTQISQDKEAMQFVGKMLEEVRDDHFIEELHALSVHVEPMREAYIIDGEEIAIQISA
jgi:hypothetical protein